MKKNFYSIVFKAFAVLVLSVMLTMVFVACNPDEDNQNHYPEGAIALTKDNFNEYFDVRVKTDCYFSYSYDNMAFPTATTYVAFVAKKNYIQVQGEVKYKVNTKVSNSFGFSTLPVAVDEQATLLKSNLYNNKAHTLTSGQPSYNEMSVKAGTDNITITDIYGYVIVGENYTPHTYQKLKEADFSSSASIQAEIEEQLADFIMPIATGDTKNYLYKRDSYYSLTSVFGKSRNLENSSSSVAKVNLEDLYYKDGNDVYYYNHNDGLVHYQYKNAFGLVVENPTTLSKDQLIASLLPGMGGIFDDNAVYVRGEHGYFAYNTLADMAESEDVEESYKEVFSEIFGLHGATQDYDKFFVTYYYSFENGFEFSVNVEHFDLHYNGNSEHIQHKIGNSFSITDINNTDVEIYTPENADFALETSKTDAMTHKTGMIDVDVDTTSFDYALCQTIYENGEYIENWLPINIIEGGIYNFECTKDGEVQTINIYDSQGNSHYDKYFEAGVYYVQHYYVPYGKTTVTMSVESTPLNDYGDFDNPKTVENNTFVANLETAGDMEAFIFEPAETGIYQFADTDVNLTISVYLINDSGNVYGETQYQHLSSYYSNSDKRTCHFDNGEKYILEVKYQYGTEPYTYNCPMDFIGNPSYDTMLLTEQWQECFVGGGEYNFYIDVEKAGYYALEYEQQDGAVVSSYSVYDSKNKWFNQYINLESGKYYVFEKGIYYFTFNLGSGNYFKGNVRLVCESEAVQEQRTISFEYNQYTDVDINLPTTNSFIEYQFVVTEKCNLLRGGYNGTLFEENGTTVVMGYYTRDLFFDKQSVVRSELEPGTYILRFASRSSGGAVNDTAFFRLQDIDEKEVLFYYMQAHPELSMEDVSMREYYTLWDGVEYFMVDSKDYEKESRVETYGAYEFHFEDTNEILVFSNGSIYTLAEAFENGIVDDDALENVYERHVYFNPDNY